MRTVGNYYGWRYFLNFLFKIKKVGVNYVRCAGIICGMKKNIEGILWVREK